jgi:hypothetical protein
MTAKGRVHDLKLKLPPGVPPTAEQAMTGLSQSFELMAVPFPNEPVGEGARWQVVSRVVNSGTDVLQFATYTLKSRNGRNAAVDIEIAQLASTSSIRQPGMPAGMTATLRKFKSTGTGTSRIDTASAAPLGSQVRVRSTMDIDVAGGPKGEGGKSKVDMTMAVELFRPAQ